MSAVPRAKSLKYISFLQKVLEHKDIIRAKFSENVRRQDKEDAWKDILKFSISIGLVTSDRNYEFVRDNTWGNLRKKTLAKLDNAKQTGAGGGPDQRFDEADNLVMEIIGVESPAIKGLGVKDSFEAGPSFAVQEHEGETGEEVFEELGEVSKSNSKKEQSRLDHIKEKQEVCPPINRKRAIPRTLFLELEEMKKMKLQAEIDVMGLQKQKLQLEIDHLKFDLFEKEMSRNVVLSEPSISVANRVKDVAVIVTDGFDVNEG